LSYTSCTTAEDLKGRPAPPNQEHNPQLEKEQENPSTPRDKASKGKTNSSSTIAKKRRVNKKIGRIETFAEIQ